MILCISVVSVVMSPLSFIILFESSLFFLSLAKGFSILSSQKNLSFIDLFIVFLVFISLISALIFITYFLEQQKEQNMDEYG